jgi:hypothetical protein
VKRRDIVMTLEDWLRAIWIDFEGFEGQSPAMLGILAGGELEQVVLDPRLAEAARAKGRRLSTLAVEIARIVAFCRAEGRVLVAEALGIRGQAWGRGEAVAAQPAA